MVAESLYKFIAISDRLGQHWVPIRNRGGILSTHLPVVKKCTGHINYESGILRNYISLLQTKIQKVFNFVRISHEKWRL